MNTCSTCKWWNRFREDGIIEEFVGMGECTNGKLYGAMMPDGKDGLHAGEAAYSPVKPYTGPNFGCVHHETSAETPREDDMMLL